MMGTYKTPHILCDMNEASAALMQFIGSDKYKEIVIPMDESGQRGFVAGLSFAMGLMMAKCRTYLYHIDESSKDGDGE